MDDKYLRYLKEADLVNPPIEGFSYEEKPKSEYYDYIMNKLESQTVESNLEKDTTVPDQPMDVQAEIKKQSSSEKDRITNLFKDLGWDKYINNSIKTTIGRT